MRLWRLAFLTVFAGGIFSGFRQYVVVSGSMEPAIPTGSIILVSLWDKEASPGEILTFRKGRSVVTHRVIRKGEKGYVTGGDANGEPDQGEVRPEDVIGKVYAWIPGLGRIVFRFSEWRRPIWLAFAACLILTAAVSAGNCLNRKKQKKKRRKL